MLLKGLAISLFDSKYNLSFSRSACRIMFLPCFYLIRWKWVHEREISDVEEKCITLRFSNRRKHIVQISLSFVLFRMIRFRDCKKMRRVSGKKYSNEYFKS